MSKLDMAERKRLPKSDFARPGKGEGKGGKGSGSYPIPDESHARNALARSSGKPEAAEVRRKVHEKFPKIGEHGMGDGGGARDGHTTSGLDHAMRQHADKVHPTGY